MILMMRHSSARKKSNIIQKNMYNFFPCIRIRYSKKKTKEREQVFSIILFQMKNLSVFFPITRSVISLSSPQKLFSGIKTIEPGNTIFQEDIVEYLENNGYEKTSLIRDIGEYAKRGSIIDVFPPSYEKPLRIEFLGDQILSIRLFNPDTQRSLTELKKCTLTYVNQSQANAGTTIVDYLNENIVFVHKGIASVTDNLSDISNNSLIKKWEDLFCNALNIDISGIREKKKAGQYRQHRMKI